MRTGLLQGSLMSKRKNINPTKSEGRYAGKDYRQLLIDNYIAIFRIDEPHKTVYVVTIQYQGRNL